MIRKAAVSVVSLLLVVGVVIGVVIVVKRNGHSQQHTTRTSSNMKRITSICEMTNYKEACAASLESTAKNSSATAQDYILAVINAPLNHVVKAIETTSNVKVDNKTDPNTYIGLEDCKYLLQYAVDTLHKSTSLAKDNNLDTIQTNQHDLLSWMSAVYALQTTCLDQIENPEFKPVIDQGMTNSTQLTHNAVNILAELSQVLKLFEQQQQQTSPRRLLLTTTSDGYPAWFDAVDRKLLAAGGGIRPNAVVGSGGFKTIGQAVGAYPANHQGRFIIYVKAGVYKEQVIIDKTKPNIYMYGDGIDKTIVTGDRNYGKQGIKTMHTATLANEAVGLIVRGVTIRNTAGPEGAQAVAFRSIGDKSAMFDCSFEANQDTLYYQSFKQFYRNCRIYGTVDFIFGKGEAVIQDSEIIVRRPMPGQFNTVTADGREIRKGSNGLVIQNSRIVPDNFLYPIRFRVPTYLGRPWKENALTVVMQCEMADFIRPEGWKVWDGANNHKTCQMYEYANHGPGANTKKRDMQFLRFKLLNTAQAARFTPGIFLAGQQWLPQTGIPYKLGL